MEAMSADARTTRPPRDLQSWQQLPVSAIANFHPVVIESLNPAEIQSTLKAHPFQRFPVARNGILSGILTRKEAEAALAENRAPKLEPAVTCLPSQNIRQLQSLLIESTSLLTVLVDRPNGKILGVVTLHDLLRAEVSLAKEGA